MTHATSWLELSRSNLAHNLTRIRALCEGADLVAVIKANAYGAGAVGMAKELGKIGVRTFAVATVEEGIELREHGISEKIVCLAPFALDDVGTVLKHELVPTVFTESAIERLVQAGPRSGPLEVWVKVDTGLHRFGIPSNGAAGFLKHLLARKELQIGAIFSTLMEDPEKDLAQVEQLVDLRKQVPELKAVPLSLASSYGILSKSGVGLLDIVRPGIVLHGFLPSGMNQLDPQRAHAADLRPIAAWKTLVVQTRVVPRGSQVGYGVGMGSDRDTPVATIFVGWSDGYARPVSTTPANVLIRGRPCPVLSVSANASMVDTSVAADVAQGDEVVLVGSQGDSEINATDLVGSAGAVYRAFANIPARVARIWI